MLACWQAILLYSYHIFFVWKGHAACKGLIDTSVQLNVHEEISINIFNIFQQKIITILYDTCLEHSKAEILLGVV
jgi:hypothetical protein